MEVKKRFKLYKSGKVWCCAAVAFAALTLGTVNGQADDSVAASSPAATTTSQVATVVSDQPASSAVASQSTATSSSSAADSSAAASAASQAQAAVTATSSTISASAAAINTSATSANVIDVSAYQGNISTATYQQYKNQGVKNVVVKLTESTNWTNSYASSQVNNAKAAGLTVSAYHFVRFTTAAAAQAEARHFAAVARQIGLPSNTLMIADVEQVSQTQYAGIANNLNVFWSTLSGLGYTNHGVYTGLAYDQRYNVSSTVGKARTWIAKYYYDYSANASRDSYIASLGYGAWQYTDRWNGVDGSIDFGMFSNYAGGQSTTSAAYLDNFNINAANNTLNVAGWFADNNNQGKNNRYVILLDQEANNAELARQQVSAVSRTDVYKVYPSIYGAANSGFNASFQITSKLAAAIAKGHRIKALIRYTSSSDGNSSYNDHYFDAVAFNKNVAYLDKMQASQSGIYVSGWHASDQSINRPYHYVILYDTTAKKELGRQQVTTTSRSDVERVNPDVYNSAKSGFSASFQMNDQIKAAIANGDSLAVISRYSGSESGNSDYVDYWFNPQSYKGNEAWLDDFSVYNGQLRVTGWHAADQSIVEPNQWIILIDTQTGKEVARTKAVTTSRSDVAAVYPSILNAGNSGFVANFDIANTSGLRAAILKGHSLKVVARYSDDAQGGEGQRTDYWFNTAKSFCNNQSAQQLESFTINGQTVVATGWYADSRSVASKAMYVILRDVTTGTELGRQAISSTNRQRPDIAAKYSSIMGSATSGFKASFSVANNSALAAALKRGDQLQIVARYTDDTSRGEGDYVQYFFAPKSFAVNAGYLDSLTVSKDGSVHASGWHVSDQSAGRPYHYLILFDDTLGHEISRVPVSKTVTRADVQKVYPGVYNSINSGFDVKFNSSAAIQAALRSGHQLQVIDRYSADKSGNSDYVDYWSVARKLS